MTAVDLIGAEAVDTLERAGYVIVTGQELTDQIPLRVVCRRCNKLIRAGRLPTGDGICKACAQRVGAQWGLGDVD